MIRCAEAAPFQRRGIVAQSENLRTIHPDLYRCYKDPSGEPKFDSLYSPSCTLSVIKQHLEL